MKRWIAGFLAVALLVALVLPGPAAAGGYRGHYGSRGHYGGHGYYGGHSHGGYFWGGLAVGAMTGLVMGSIFAPRVYAVPPPVVYQPAPPPVVYQPAPPAVVYQPAPVCATRWVDTYWSGYGWVPGHWEQYCR
jgi:hypothetical protein